MDRCMLLTLDPPLSRGSATVAVTVCQPRCTSLPCVLGPLRHLCCVCHCRLLHGSSLLPGPFLPATNTHTRTRTHTNTLTCTRTHTPTHHVHTTRTCRLPTAPGAARLFTAMLALVLRGACAQAGGHRQIRHAAVRFWHRGRVHARHGTARAVQCPADGAAPSDAAPVVGVRPRHTHPCAPFGPIQHAISIPTLMSLSKF